MTADPVQTLDHAMKSIANEMFQNGPEEGCRIWEDYNHPLQQAFAILFRAQVQLQSEDPAFRKKAMALLEQHRLMEEGM